MNTYNKELKKVWDKKLKEEYGENYEQEYKFRQNLSKEIEKQIKLNTDMKCLEVDVKLIEEDNKINECLVEITIPIAKATIFTLKNLTDKKRIKEIAEENAFLFKRGYIKFLQKELEKLNK